jgi:uncharacterized membrane protein YiaA
LTCGFSYAIIILQGDFYMNWTILFVGIILFIIGMYATSDMHNQLEKQGHHWSNALEIGSKAGMIWGFGLGLIVAAAINLIF